MIIALNNKSNLTKQDFEKYQEELKKINSEMQLILCPNLLNIGEFHLENFKLGAQNVSETTDGAYTGEVSANQLKSYEVEYCIVGHSERRMYQKETLETISKKINKLFENEITPILCIGETLEEKESGKVEEILLTELTTAIVNLTEAEKDKLIVAYEPIWSIGTGIIPSNEDIKKTLKFIKTILPNSKILYGGSANENNIDTLKEIELIDGYLLGGLSLKPNDLEKFVNKLEK